MLNRYYTRAFIALFLPLVAIFFWGCSNSSSGSSSFQEGLQEIVLADIEERDIIFPNNLPDSCRFIALETTDNSLIKEVYKVEFADSLIFVQDYNTRVLVFDSDGKFINQIGENGRGRGEYFSLKTFYVDSPSKTVVIVDLFGNAFLTYDYSGKFLNEIKFDDFVPADWGSTTKIFKFVEGFAHVGIGTDSTLILVHNAYKDFEYHFSILNTNTKQIVSTTPQTFDFSANVFPGKHDFSASEKYMFVQFSDTIYRYVPPYGVEPAYLITTSMKHIDSTALESWKGLSNYDFYINVSHGGYSRGPLLMQASDSYMVLHVNDGDYQYRVVIDLKSGCATKSNLSYFAETDRAYLPFSFQSTYVDGFVAVIKAMDMVECAGDEFVKGHAELNSICATLNDDDNPILGIYFISQ